MKKRLINYLPLINHLLLSFFLLLQLLQLLNVKLFAEFLNPFPFEYILHLLLIYHHELIFVFLNCNHVQSKYYILIK